MNLSWKLFCIFITYVVSVDCNFEIPNGEAEKGHDFWMSSMKSEIYNALKKPINNKIAKNIIIFLGDGMGITASTAGRIFKGQKQGVSGEESSLAWENFPNIALMKTYNLDKQVPDSAATATAFFGGVKSNYYTLGVNGKVTRGNCEQALDVSNWVTSILQWAQEANKDTGIVTTSRITHATPAALYSHSFERFVECDSKLNETHQNLGCKDIARQLIENSPGKDINVIFGGGRRQLGNPLPGDEGGCERNDSRNLVNEWKKQKMQQDKSFAYLTNTEELLNLDADDTDYILGLFSGNHLNFDSERDKTATGEPSLKQLTQVALTRLTKNDNGYFLMVEGGRIDHGLHQTKPHKALEEIVAFDEAVRAALQIVGDDDETLIIVTADHSHVMTMNGYPARGQNIFGTNTYDYVTDKMPYPTLMFTNGYGFHNTFGYNGTHVVRKNLSQVDTTDLNYVSPSIVPTTYDAETHGGEDVAAYATGPMSHLFHKVHEQSYVAHVMGFAACIGPYKEDCERHHDDSVYTLDERLMYDSSSTRNYLYDHMIVVSTVLSLCSYNFNLI